MLRLRESVTLIVGLASASILAAKWAEAQIDLGAWVANAPDTTFRPYLAKGSDRVPVLVRVPETADDEALAEGLIRLNSGLYATYRRSNDLSAAITRHADWKWIWSPPRRLLLNHVTASTRIDVAREAFGRRGAGVIVGIVDTGLDLYHPDFRTAGNLTRVAWYLDLTQKAPLGLHAELEQAAGCTAPDTPCAVYDADDINKMLAAPQSATAFPIDAIGHGTHVASLAAGNGLSNVPPKYVGVAPDADLVIVNASRANLGDVQDIDIIRGVQFVFQVAGPKYMNEPAVVNLSLGGDAGAHDGTSTLERELSALVGPEQPGRAIVVAAGNSADLYDTSSAYPKPLGIHTSVQVLPDGNKTRVPIVVDKSVAPDIDSTFIVWIQSREGDVLSVGVDTESGECIAPMSPGGVVEDKQCAGAQISLYNGLTEATQDPNGGSKERPAIAMFAQGKFASPSVFSMTFQGSGTAFVWVQSQDGLNPALGSLGALVPAATRERTVAIPASASGLIAVGATLNRLQWIDVANDKQTLKRFGSVVNPIEGDIASFSGGGPNQLDQMKPDILAPGGYVIGAMANLADPRRQSGQNGMFDSTGACDDSTTTAAECPDKTNKCVCYVIDNRHGVAVGTSMASPIVAGAIALLFEGNRTLTQDDVRRYIQAGAQQRLGFLTPAARLARPRTLAQEGPGVLDVDGALRAQTNDPTPSGAIAPDVSWFSVATGLVHPDDHWPTPGALHLRDAAGNAVSIDPSRIKILFSPGFLLTPIQFESYGYYTFDFTAGDGAGRQTMNVDVQVDDRSILKEQLFIGVDVPSARGDVVGGRGCSVSIASTSGRSIVDLLGALGCVVIARRRRTRSKTSMVARGLVGFTLG